MLLAKEQKMALKIERELEEGAIELERELEEDARARD
jgi:hypothetical protein